MHELVRHIPWAKKKDDLESLLKREWLVTNGLGGYASGTVAGVATRRYHGLLIAALPAPLGRIMTLSHLSEKVRMPGGEDVLFGGDELGSGALDVHGAPYLVDFRLEFGLPVWQYDIDGVGIEKYIVLPHGQNTVFVIYRQISGAGPVRLKLLPSVHFRSHDAAVSTPLPLPFTLTITDRRHELCAHGNLPRVRMFMHGERPAFTAEAKIIAERMYRLEYTRGYDARGSLWSPGYFRVDLSPGKDAALVVSTERWETIDALSSDDALKSERLRSERLLAQAEPQARVGLPAELVLAADQFLIKPAGRIEDAARAAAAGDEARTVIAGYHWFTDWGRDTMISLEGLTLATGRYAEAGYILRTFATHIRDGLIPNLFPEGEKEGLYHTADATLWFFHALDRYFTATGDRTTLEVLLPELIEIAHWHVRGTRFNIGVDPADGLLRQGADGYQLTWMDAKVGDWVVTPRRGKAVEINALWFNALKLLEKWLRSVDRQDEAERWAEQAERARDSFNRRFWYEQGGYLYDVIDGEHVQYDASLRPNQLLAISLDYPILDRQRWDAVLRVCREKLLTPFGLRSLAPGSPDYKDKYYGDLRARDAAYHQGTVWAWLIGPYVDAWLKLQPGDRQAAHDLLYRFDEQLSDGCVGSISEIFDAESPFTPRGCIAQAWSVAEVLRCLVKTAPRDSTAPAQPSGGEKRELVGA
ncbi:MAG: glycogen debranching enzyme family protein [Pirellulales bacterium]|nr:glycogen debranching enzyme family protein [Pirellulales bacterium]